jgi:ribosomal protein S18 acetylase RimI-like enzyme
MIRFVEAVEPEHLEHARTLFRAYANEFAATIAESLCFQNFEAELAGLPGRYTPPSGCILLAMDGERPAGCVALRDLGHGICEMKRLYIRPEWRGRGIGKQLAEAILHKAREAGYSRMRLDSIAEMESALALYRSLGFVEIAPYWDNPIEEAVYRELDLVPAEIRSSQSEGA